MTTFNSNLVAGNILIVDDEVELLEELQELILFEGYACHTATSGSAALSLLSTRADIEIVISDIRMPEMDGLELLAQIRTKYTDRPWLQFIFITGHASLDFAVQALRLDAVDFLSKPIRKGDLLPVIQMAVQRAKSERRVLHEVLGVSVGSNPSRVDADIARVIKVISAFPRPAIDLQLTADGVIGAGSTSDSRPMSDRALQNEDMALSIIQRIVTTQSLRSSLFFGKLFTEPAWDMLLELMKCRLSGKKISVNSLCITSGSPVTTALRRIEDMEAANLIAREPDPKDGRRSFLVLTDDGAQKMANYLLTVYRLFREGT